MVSLQLSKWTQSFFALLAITLLALTPRLIQLGTSLTIDEPLWIDRGEAYINRISTFQFEAAIPSIQPGITTSWITGLTAPWNSLAASQAGIAITSTILILTASYFLILNLGLKWGFLASLVLALEPFLVAHGRVAHTDSLLALSMLNSLLAAIVYGEFLLAEKKASYRYLIVSGFFIVFAILTKVFALALLPIIFITIFFYRFHTKTLSKYPRDAGIFIVAMAFSSILIWPTLIVAPYSIAQQLYEGISNHAGGSPSDAATSRWWYYPREIIFRSTPVTAFFLIPTIFLFPSLRKKDQRVFGILALAGLFYTFILSIKGEKSDRYILFTMITLALFSVSSFMVLYDWIVTTIPAYKKWLFPGIVGMVGTILVWLLVAVFPYPLAYYNPLYPIEPTHKLGWGEGLEEAASWLTDNHPNAPVYSYYSRVLSYFYTGDGPVDSLNHISDNESSYLVLYRSMLERSKSSPETDLMQQYVLSNKKAAHIIFANGLPYVWIYEHK